ncbi:hypothetical protein OC842_004789 [Tilletia horrida]|uniref:Uncharacterized protein n=1 Tax=Tilletia horrida TaxID=155126 RepID=A0AAN6JJ79_9BASI|nr:hypothetical protein OC842_004789 [Tilletia horrida]
MPILRPDLVSLLSSTDLNVARRVTLHNACLASVSPDGWRAHVFDLTADVVQSGLLQHDRDAGTLRIRRLPPAAFPGHAVLHQDRPLDVQLADLDKFKSRFDLMSNRVFRGLNSREIFFSGGSVLACLTTDPSRATNYVRSDIDIFLTTRTTKAARAVVAQIESVLHKNIPGFDHHFRVFRSPDVITFVPSDQARAEGYRKIQVITALHRTPCDIVANFDLDPVCVFYDLQRVFITPRAMRAFWTGFTTVTAAIRSVSGSRILKYAQRGYGLLLPNTLIRGCHDFTLSELFAKERSKVFLRLMDRNLVYTDLSGTLAIIKPARFGEWTHSATDLAHLVALWEIVHGHPNLQSELIYLAQGAAGLYGLYNEPQVLNIHFNVARHIEAFANFGFIEPQPVEHIPNVEEYAAIGIREFRTAQEACLASVPITVILPVGLRFRLVRDFHVALAAKPYSDVIVCSDHIRFELCTWDLSPADMWAPPTHRSVAPVHRLLKRAANLASWALHKAHFGALWGPLHLGAKFHATLDNNVDATYTAEAHFVAWLSAGERDGCHCTAKF